MDKKLYYTMPSTSNYHVVSLAVFFLVLLAFENTNCLVCSPAKHFFGIQHRRPYSCLGLSYDSASSKRKALMMVVKGENTGDSDSDDGQGNYFDEETARNPSAEIANIKAKIEVAKEEGDMDTVMTLMGTLLALGGGYDNET